jgi:nucleoside-diphosphate-sugar epimerase
MPPMQLVAGEGRRMILVTGAFGFVGRHLVPALRERFPDTAVRALDIQQENGALPAGVEGIQGDLQDRERLREGLEGVETVVHLAAKVAPNAQDSDEMRRVNVDGTVNVYTAAVAEGCTFFLHMSSAGVYGQPRHPQPFHEDEVVAPETPYQRSKWEAERALRQIDSGDLTLNMLRPAGIYGPGSSLEIPLYRSIRNRRWTIDVRGGVIVHPTYIRDIVEGILALVGRPAGNGAVFNIGGEQTIQLQSLQALLAKTMGVSRTCITLPTWFATPLEKVGEPILARRGRSNPLLSRMCRGELFSAAVDDARFRSSYPEVPITPLEQGLRETIDWATGRRLL